MITLVRKGIQVMMFRRFHKPVLLMVGIVSALCGVLLSGGFVYAEPSVNIQKKIIDKAVYQGVRKCYENGMLKSSIDLGSYGGMESLMAEGANAERSINLVSGGHDGLMGRMINNGAVRYNISSDSLSCYELFVGGERGFWEGSGSAKGILQATGNEVPDAGSSEKVVEFFKNMGYTVSEGSEGTCYRVTYSVAETSRQSKNKICSGENGKLFVEPPSSEPIGVDVGFSVNDDNEVCLVFATATGRKTECSSLGDGRVLNQDSLVATIQNICNDGGRKGVCTFVDYDTSLSYKFSDAVPDVTEGDAVSGRYAYLASSSIPGGPSTTPADRAISFLSKGSMGEDLAISKAEKRILYQEYLTQYYGYKVDCATEHLNTGSIWWFDEASGTVKQCSVTETGNNLDERVHAVNDAGLFEGTVNAEAIKQYLNLNYSYTPEEIAEMGATSSSELENNVLDDCRNSGAGKNLGYLLCTVLELAGETVEGTYNELIEPALSAKTEFFTGNSASGEQVPYQAWQRFRDIANMIFVILLLVVIFSQLTGLGIDNYGIKRILPKLIVSVILINMSYLICMIAIDVSNIVGNGAQALFENLGNGLTDNISIEGNSVGASTTSGLVSFGLAGGLAAMTGAIWASPLILLTLLPSVLGALVAVFFLFFLVSARQAAIVVLVVLSPLAVACSILPNTKSFFSKYLKIFEAMLLIYPVTSVLVEGGNYVSKLLLQVGGNDNFSLALTAMVVGIIPIFFIPSMIKDSFAALGKIGGTISGFGRTAGNRLSGAARGTEAFKAIQEKEANNRARWRAGVGKNGQVKELSDFGKLIRGGSGRVNLSRANYQSIRNTEALRDELGDYKLYQQRLDSAEEERALKASREMYSNMGKNDVLEDSKKIDQWLGQKGGKQRVAALMETLVANGNQKRAYELLEGHDFTSSPSVMGSLANSSDKILKAYGKKAANTGVSFEAFMNGTGRYNKEDVTLKSYAKDKGASFLSGLDDKALSAIRAYDSASGSQTMSTQQLLGAAKTLDSDDALSEVAKMLEARSDINFSADDYTKYDESIKRVIRNQYEASLKKGAAGVNDEIRKSVELAKEKFESSPTTATRLNEADQDFFSNKVVTPTGGGSGSP